MLVVVTGGFGLLGSEVARLLAEGGHRVRVVSSRPRESRHAVAVADLADGSGLEEALSGAEAVVHCASDYGRHREVDREGTRRLLLHLPRSAQVAYPGIVGSDVIPLAYYRSKLAAEEAVLASPGGTVIRATQFHQFVWWLLERLGRYPLMVVPRETRAQPLDPTALARRLVEAVEERAGGRLEDIGGPHAYEVRDLARSYLAATGQRKPVVRVNWPGVAGAALRAGANLTPNRAQDGMTWNDFVATKA